MYLKISYKIYGTNSVKEKKIFLNKESIQTEDFTLNSNVHPNFFEYSNIEIEIIPKIEIEIMECLLVFPNNYDKRDKVFINGYQSWTDSKEVSINHKDRKFLHLLRPVIQKYKFQQYGDYGFYKYENKNGVFHSVTYTYIKNYNDMILFVGSLNDYSAFTFIEHDSIENKITIKRDMVGKILKTKETLYKLFIKKTDKNDIFKEYFDLMGLNKKPDKIFKGWTSWYNYYENISEELIIKNLKNYHNQNIEMDYFQIDDGYQNAVGDWLIVNSKFPKGMSYLAEMSKEFGYKPGIWLAPFSAEKKSKLVKNHPDWILKDEKGEFVYGGSNWSSFYALDIYNKDFRAYLKEVFDTMINKWGYQMFKLDFLYSACLLPREDKTRGEVMRDAMELLRELIGDKEILACGVPIASAFGIVDYCRIGCDIGLDWDDKFYMKYMHRERISTKNAIKNSIYRYHMNSYAFYNDPDVFLLRDDNISLTKNQKETLFWVNNLFGSLVFTSDDISEYNAYQKELYKKSLEIKSKKILEIYEEEDLFYVKVLINNEKMEFIINLDNKKRKWLGKSIGAFCIEYWKMED